MALLAAVTDGRLGRIHHVVLQPPEFRQAADGGRCDLVVRAARHFDDPRHPRRGAATRCRSKPRRSLTPTIADIADLHLRFPQGATGAHFGVVAQSVQGTETRRERARARMPCSTTRALGQKNSRSTTTASNVRPGGRKPCRPRAFASPSTNASPCARSARISSIASRAGAAPHRRGRGARGAGRARGRIARRQVRPVTNAFVDGTGL